MHIGAVLWSAMLHAVLSAIQPLQPLQKVIIVTSLHHNFGYLKLVFDTFTLIIFVLHILLVYFHVSCLFTDYILQILIDIDYLLFLNTLKVASFLMPILVNHLFHTLLFPLPLSWLTNSCITSSRLPSGRLPSSRLPTR